MPESSLLKKSKALRKNCKLIKEISMAKYNKNYRNEEQDRRLKTIEGHVKTINGELGDVKIDIAGIKTDVSWLKRFFFIVATASVGALVVALLNLLTE